MSADLAHMRAALALARRGLGGTWPNPAVGCVIVRDGRVVGRGNTAPGGRPHAEVVALTMAGEAARGATAYVTLEPCSHHGQTPPCADALIAAGVARVVVAVGDPDPRVSGAGIAKLRAAGITVDEGVLREEAGALNDGFFKRVVLQRPLLTLKLASTLDGRIALETGVSQWITGPEARRATHALRGQHDAVMVGIGTVRADDPDLSCRLPGYASKPTVRIVVDSRLRLSLTSRLVVGASQTPTWVITCPDADADRRKAMQAAGVVLIDAPRASVGVDIAAGMRALAERGLTRVMCEGGAQLAAAVLRADLVDRVAWFHAPAVMGGDGWPAAAAFGVTELSAMPRFRRIAMQTMGDDMLTEFVRAD